MTFHVPHNTRLRDFELKLYGCNGDDGNGVFRFRSVIPGRQLHCIASNGLGWEHVSVQAIQGKKSRLPSWPEMCQVKAMFWDESDTVIQIHPPENEYVNQHPNILHLWRPIDQTIPMPRSIMVGLKDGEDPKAALEEGERALEEYEDRT